LKPKTTSLIRLIACVLVFLSAPFFPALVAQEGENSRIAALRAKAGQGDGEAQYELGRAYADGKGVTKDLVEAVKWYRKGAAQGNTHALNYLGEAYAQGKGVDENPIEAVKCWRQAAEQGGIGAQYNLGRAYARGYGGLPKDPAEAEKWYRKAADQGWGPARAALKALGTSGSPAPSTATATPLPSASAPAKSSGAISAAARPATDASAVSKGSPGVFTFKTDDGVYQFTIDTTQAPPELDAWAREKLVPAVKKWYPKIVRFLPSKGYSAPKDVSITFKKHDWQATTYGSRIVCNTDWFLQYNKNDCIGVIIHELVHVVQSFGRNWDKYVPLWLSEGIADYVRSMCMPYPDKVWDAQRLRYDGSYKMSANFLRWVAGAYDKDIVPKLTAAGRQHNYSDKLWKQYTGHTIQELNDEWKAFLAQPERPILKHSLKELQAAVLQDQASPEKAK